MASWTRAGHVRRERSKCQECEGGRRHWPGKGAALGKGKGVWKMFAELLAETMMVSRAFHQEKKFGRTDFTEKIAVHSLNGSHLHAGRGMLFRES